MHATLFSLVVADRPELVVAWGMEIAYDENPDGTEPERKAIVCLDVPNGEGTIATHTSAEAARDRWGMKVPLDIVWDADVWAEFYRQSS